MLEILGAILHFIFFIIIVVVLITLGGRNSARYVFTADSGGASGWENPGVAWYSTHGRNPCEPSGTPANPAAHRSQGVLDS